MKTFCVFELKTKILGANCGTWGNEGSNSSGCIEVLPWNLTAFMPAVLLIGKHILGNYFHFYSDNLPLRFFAFKKIVEKIGFHYTPKHGSWLNVAENELSSMNRQCLKDRKMTNIDMLKKETSAWATNSNGKQRGVN